MAKKAALHNLGCKVNAYELESMQQRLEAAGYEIVPFDEGADVYVINTCTVTNIADRKSRQMLHKAKKMNHDAVVVAVGCYAQVQEEALREDPDIDLVIGTNKKNDLVSELERYFVSGEQLSDWEDVRTGRVYEEMTVDRTESHTRAFIKVQDGCDQFCSYCIIPYARGRVRSRAIQDVVSETVRLAASGVKELVLTGIHLCSYGRDLKNGDDFRKLILAVHEVDGIERIRLGSLEPGSIDEDFVQTMASLPKICPHFHLSLQSGCDETLRRMNRRYTTADFEELVGWFRKYYDDPAITTDIIAGFPGETEQEFEECVRFVEKISFFETHIFPYSKRAGTKAAEAPGQLTEQEKKARCKVLRELDERNRIAFMNRHIGQPVEVLFEEQIFTEGKTWWVGHTPRYEKVLTMDAGDLTNEMRTGIPEGIMAGDYLLFQS